FFIKGWERVVGLAGNINEGTKLELLHQSIKGSGKKIADAYVNGVKTSYAGLKKYLQATYELSPQCRRVRVLKRYNSLRLANQPSLTDFKKFQAQWVLLCQQLSELSVGLDDNKKALDFLEKLPDEITRYIHLQYKDAIEKFDIQKMIEVDRKLPLLLPVGREHDPCAASIKMVD
ncbi:AP-1 complex subunit sigma-1A, partial [Perkinsus olseni]